jgi:Rad3-related DNA helicase
LDLEDLDNHHFQSISSVQTDPSQQGILHALEKKRNILIQGPPGTGKSQTLTAILINALENHKKTLVVCEKRTALDVLHNALIEKELGNNCILIRDIVKDRRAVIDSVRGRVDTSSYKKYNYSYSKEPLSQIITKAKSLIDVINGRHQKLDKKLLGDKNWTAIVGELLAQLNNEEPLQPIKINEWNFTYTSKELNELLEVVNEGDVLYSAYQPCIDFTFLNPNVFLVDNPYQLEKELKTAFHQIELDLNEIEKLSTNRTWWQRFFYPKLRRAINELKNRVNSNKLSNKLIESAKNEDILAEIKLIIEQSKAYFEKNQLFIAEYNWQSYYKNLDVQSAKIVDDLKGKEQWRRLALIKYLQSILTHFADNRSFFAAFSDFAAGLGGILHSTLHRSNAELVCPVIRQKASRGDLKSLTSSVLNCF